MHCTVILDLDAHGGSVKSGFNISNAHNEYERQAAVDAVADLVPALLPWVQASLKAPSTHVHTARDGQQLLLPKTVGGDQGDAITALFFPSRTTK